MKADYLLAFWKQQARNSSVLIGQKKTLQTVATKTVNTGKKLFRLLFDF